MISSHNSALHFNSLLLMQIVESRARKLAFILFLQWLIFKKKKKTTKL